MENGTRVGGIVACFEFEQGKVVEARMRTNVVVMTTPGFDHDPGFGAATEPFDRKGHARKRARPARAAPASCLCTGLKMTKAGLITLAFFYGYSVHPLGFSIGIPYPVS